LLDASVEKLGFKRRTAAVAPAETLTLRSLRDWLENAVQRGFIHYPFLSRPDVVFAKLRGQPRFFALLGRIRFGGTCNGRVPGCRRSTNGTARPVAGRRRAPDGAKRSVKQ
jgi:hypothetical protein